MSLSRLVGLPLGELIGEVIDRSEDPRDLPNGFVVVSSDGGAVPDEVERTRPPHGEESPPAGLDASAAARSHAVSPGRGRMSSPMSRYTSEWIARAVGSGASECRIVAGISSSATGTRRRCPPQCAGRAGSSADCRSKACSPRLGPRRGRRCQPQGWRRSPAQGSRKPEGTSTESAAQSAAGEGESATKVLSTPWIHPCSGARDSGLGSVPSIPDRGNVAVVGPAAAAQHVQTRQCDLSAA